MMSTSEYVARTVYPRSDASVKESKAVEKKSPDEVTALREALGRGICPDCGHDEFCYGPRGGCSVNIECHKCGARFNVCPPILFERIGRRESL